MDAAALAPFQDARSKEQGIVEYPQQQESPPVWDEATGLFWCKTSVNGYDVPDARDWKKLFQEEVDRQRPEAARMLGLGPLVLSSGAARRDAAWQSPPMRALRRWPSASSPSPRGGPACEPVTPTRVPSRLPRDSPKTPPNPVSCSERRIARAAHTKALTNIKQKSGVSTVVQGKELGFFRFGGKVFAVAARCPHQGGLLCEGEVGDIEDNLGGRSCYVTCPVHKMQFDLESGGVIVGDCPPLETFRVRIGETDEQGRTAMIEVGFASLSETYFGDDDVDF
mmetsp:Transcript_40202/g.87648  ORF Transcript_40202/g.87648 Transcript_40202/m.87648 type:complete len:281 (+) Transcript_40202:67-909(+)